MPGKEVANWPQYHALRDQGYSKEAAARITNDQARRNRRKRKKRLRGRLKSAAKKVR